MAAPTFCAPPAGSCSARAPRCGPGSQAAKAGFLSSDRLPSSDLRGEPGALPYIGVGYSGLGGRSGWSFSADFGLMALGAGNAIRLGRSGNYQGVDDWCANCA
ncbi:hypothetical protein FSC37_16565 [Piscinibacter aquaticus]|uniref:Uncharacterized protein n=1 Tax=Piscinibacter aquaticus TaxID=392597 RepID=A0A5C6U471_9BURK|nr:hypothetical protein FSC37_16565 [Piscinibacter aquaticus]